jgi:hypothetical protein
MSNAKMPDDPKDPTGPAGTDGPRKGGGGFGAFADLYRARWAANHPDMNQRWSPEDTPAPSTPAATGAETDAAGETPDRAPQRPDTPPA